MKILFVCHGNICRSPLAEFVMRHLLNKAQLENVEVESAALHTDEIGSDIYYETRRSLIAHGIPFSPRKAWLFRAPDAKRYDIVCVMDEYNWRDIARILPREDIKKVHYLMEFAGKGQVAISDPWYTRRFEDTFRDVLTACQGLLDYLSTAR